MGHQNLSLVTAKTMFVTILRYLKDVILKCKVITVKKIFGFTRQILNNGFNMRVK